MRRFKLLALTALVTATMALTSQAAGRGGGHFGGGYHGGGHGHGRYYGGYRGGWNVSIGWPLWGYGYYPSYGYSTYYTEPAVSGTVNVAASAQSSLARRGYYRGPIDGILGPGSCAAIRAWQRDTGLPMTGALDRATLRSLGL